MNPTRRSVLQCPLRFLAVVVAMLAGGCGGDDKAGQRAPDSLLIVDGIEITLAETEPYVAFLDSFLPEGGRKAKVKRVLDEHLLPLRMSQRAFPAERKLALERATALADVATNAIELDQQSQLLQDRSRHNTNRLQPKLPVAMFLFQPLLAGSVSRPIELPRGYVVTAAFDFIESPSLVLDDYVDALGVSFMTHDVKTWYEWYNAECARLRPLVTYVHPDYREAIPPWLDLPKLP